MFQDRLDLASRHSGKPLKEIVNGRAVFYVIKKRAHRHTCTPENPCAAELPWNSFHFRTIVPITFHGITLAGSLLKLNVFCAIQCDSDSGEGMGSRAIPV